MNAILGINAYHGDSSACLVVDGNLIASVEEERFRRIKHWAGFPSLAIQYCLREGSCSLSDIDAVAINSDPWANLGRKLWYLVSSGKLSVGLVRNRLANARARQSVEEQLHLLRGSGQFSGEVHRIEHHLCHLVSAHVMSPFENSIAVSIDGFGDFASAAWGMGRGSDIRVEDRVSFPDSLGVFYQALTQFLGFCRYGDEYKVMGLAPYGEPRYVDQIRTLLHLHDDGKFSLQLNYFRHHHEQTAYTWDGGPPEFGILYSQDLIALLGPARDPEEPITQRHMDLARSVQTVYEDTMHHLLAKLCQRYDCENVSLAGGCAMNSVANGRIYDKTPARRVFVQPAAGDAGGAVGAAFALNRDHNGQRFTMTHAYWGPAFSDRSMREAIEHGLDQTRQSEACCWTRVDTESELIAEIARAISEGQVVGWFQGRMEWGPRALGNRSILGDPRRTEMKDILNAKIKRRESFRPFAPSVLRDHVNAWFETDDDVPFMMKVFRIREEKRKQIPAVTHVDGTGRLQTVTPESNPRYYALIQAFHALTDVPMVLNTSFNENEPIVCTPEEAMQCFLRTNMDILVLGDFVVSRT